MEKAKVMRAEGAISRHRKENQTYETVRYNNNSQNNLHLLSEMTCKPSTLTCLHKSTHEQ